jgi:hypothetical protein
LDNINIYGVDYLAKIIGDIEEHSVEGIKECFANGVSPNDHFNNEPLINELTSEYTRTPRFKDCVKTFVDYGLIFEDKALLMVLLDDAQALDRYVNTNPNVANKRYSLRCAYTPLSGVTLLHTCAEFNHVASAEVLVKHGADVNARAEIDENGFGGHTPIFHTVNQNSNNSSDMLNYLLANSADLGIMVRGFIWGKGYPWETFIPSVTPINYAMMGLLPQMHRSESTIAKVISLLLKTAHGINYALPNVPNKYLQG